MTTPTDARKLLHELLDSGFLDLRSSPLPAHDVGPMPTDYGFDRVEGMLLGVAIGDALGTTSEAMTPLERRRRHGEIRDYLPGKVSSGPIGYPSDDTQLTYWALERMIADGAVVPERIAESFASGHIYGIGRTVRAFLREFGQGDRPWWQCAERSAGNGALMRISPVLVPHLRSGTRDLWVDATLLALITHHDTASLSACITFVAMLWDLLQMSAPPEPGWWVDRYVETAGSLETDRRYQTRGGAYRHDGPLSAFVDQHVRAAYREGLSCVGACNRWYSGAYLLETVPSALYILMLHADDPEEAIVRAVNDTWDNDTIASIVGAAVGALHGREALPPRWIDNLSGRTRDDDDGRVFELIAQAREAFWTQNPAKTGS